MEYYFIEKVCLEGKYRISILLEDLIFVLKVYLRIYDYSFLLEGLEVKFFLSVDFEKEIFEWI